MKKIFVLCLMAQSLQAMEPIEDVIIRSRAASASSEESQLEEQMNDLIRIFADVQQIEDQQYVEAVLNVLARHRQETAASISPYLSKRLRDSYVQVKELTEARQHSSLKKLMKQLIADSINEAFVKVHLKQEEQTQEFQMKIKYHRYGLAIAIVSGIATTLTAFLAAYFGHSC